MRRYAKQTTAGLPRSVGHGRVRIDGTLSASSIPRNSEVPTEALRRQPILCPPPFCGGFGACGAKSRTLSARSFLRFTCCRCRLRLHLLLPACRYSTSKDVMMQAFCNNQGLRFVQIRSLPEQHV